MLIYRAMKHQHATDYMASIYFSSQGQYLHPLAWGNEKVASKRHDPRDKLVGDSGSLNPEHLYQQ